MILRSCSDAALDRRKDRGRKEPATDRSGQLLTANAISKSSGQMPMTEWVVGPFAVPLPPDGYRRSHCRYQQPYSTGSPGLHKLSVGACWEPIVPRLLLHPTSQPCPALLDAWPTVSVLLTILFLVCREYQGVLGLVYDAD